MRWLLLLCELIVPVMGWSVIGGEAGGGASEEARIFARVAWVNAKVFESQQTQPRQISKYGRQLLDTLADHLEIKFVSSLTGLCDGRATQDLVAYSCRKEINLLVDPWVKWLSTEAAAQAHSQEIVHEVSRASNSLGVNFVSKDEGYGYTTPLFTPNPTTDITSDFLVQIAPTQPVLYTSTYPVMNPDTKQPVEILADWFSISVVIANNSKIPVYFTSVRATIIGTIQQKPTVQTLIAGLGTLTPAVSQTIWIGAGKISDSIQLFIQNIQQFDSTQLEVGLEFIGWTDEATPKVVVQNYQLQVQ